MKSIHKILLVLSILTITTIDGTYPIIAWISIGLIIILLTKHKLNLRRYETNN